MDKKELIKIINNFVKLNPKKEIYPKIDKYYSKVFFDVQNLFKNNLKLINQSNYNLIFSSKDGKFLSGKKWIEILFTSKNINDYHTNLRRNFQICNQKLLFENISDDLFFIFYHDKKIVAIEASEINFDINTKKQLEKIRYFLDKHDWSIYFFELQKLMHEQIIKLLDWKNKSLNYNSYIEILNQKLSFYINDLNIVKNYNETIKQINLYRNLLSKATSIIPSNTIEWNSINDLTKKLIAWKLYFSLTELINCFNLINLDKKS